MDDQRITSRLHWSSKIASIAWQMSIFITMTYFNLGFPTCKNILWSSNIMITLHVHFTKKVHMQNQVQSVSAFFKVFSIYANHQRRINMLQFHKIKKQITPKMFRIVMTHFNGSYGNCKWNSNLEHMLSIQVYLNLNGSIQKVYIWYCMACLKSFFAVMFW